MSEVPLYIMWGQHGGETLKRPTLKHETNLCFQVSMHVSIPLKR